MQKTILSLIFLFLSVLTNAQPPKFKWAKNLTAGAYQVITDEAGNVYACGTFYNTVDFDPGVGTFNLSTSANNYHSNPFILKLDPKGNFLWVKTIGETSYYHKNSIAVDALGNIYWTSGFKKTMDLDPGTGIFNLSSATDSTDDIFILKLDGAGNFVWAKKVGGVLNDKATDIFIDKTGNVCISGSFDGTVDFDPNAGVVNLTSVSGSNTSILKLDPAGNFLWAKNMGKPFGDMTLDKNDNIYFSGLFKGTIDFDPGAGVVNLTSDPLKWLGDVFISKLDAAGNFKWVKKVGGISNTITIKIDGIGNVYTAGRFHDTVDFDPGPGAFNLISPDDGSGFILKLDEGGNFSWVKKLEGNNFTAQAIAIDRNENVYITGQFYDSADLDPNAGVFNVISAVNCDVFILKLDAAGNFIWAGSVGSSPRSDGTSIAINHSGNIYVSGYFTGTADFDSGRGTSILKQLSKVDMFILKMNQAFLSTNYNIYPNPNDGLFNISLINPTGNISIEVYTSIGQLLYKQGDIDLATTIDISNYASGLYIVRMMRDNVIMGTEKIIKR